MNSRLAVTKVGIGAPRFAFLHGLFGRGRNWTQIANGLAVRDGAALLIDLPNHGQSPWTDQFSYVSMAEAVVEELGRHSNRPLILVGHSMGGKVAMLAAIRHPDAFVGLGVVDVAPADSAQVSSFGPYVSAMLGLDLTTLTSKAEADLRLSMDVPDAAVRQFLLTNLRDRNGWRWQPNLELLGQSLDELAGWPNAASGTFDGPTSWIVGEHSPYYRPNELADVQRYFPAAVTNIIAGAGHWVHADNPSEVIAVLSELSAASPTQ